MICVSSFRPLTGCASEIAANQIAAFESWCKVFDDIVYFNDPEPKLTAAQVTFIPSENWPKIKQLIGFAAQMEGWTAIINADIMVTTDFLVVEEHLKSVGATCALSNRYEFVPLNPIVPKRVTDKGLDIFCATPQVWQTLLPLVPDEFRIGHSQWDSWCLSAMNEFFRDTFYDFTIAEVIYHPRHGNRKYEFEVPQGLTPFQNFAPPKPIV